MIFLTIDTSGKNGSLALAKAAPEGTVEVVEEVPLEGGTFSAQLVPQIASLLKKHNLTKQDLAGFGVISGPGSFTGLRVGLAAVKALAEVLQKPVAAVSLLEAIARASATRGKVLAAIDAGRSEVYVGEYELPDAANASEIRSRERLLTREEFLNEVKGKTVVTSDSAIAEILVSSGAAVERVDYPEARQIARLGWERIQRGQTVSPEALEANYIRRSDAEIFSQPKS